MTDTSDDDDFESEMRDAMDELTGAGIRFARKSPYQLKIGPWNYYPSKGTIHRDGDKKALKARGLRALLDLISDQKNRRRGPDTEGVARTLDIGL
jgi:hypothetical protein